MQHTGLSLLALKLVTRLHVFLFRLTNGVIGSYLRGIPMLLVTTRGRKSGRAFTTPLTYLEENGVYYLVASYGGSDVEPSWWSNMKVNPRVRVETRGRAFIAEARETDPDTKARMWKKFVLIYPSYDTYQRRTSRPIPIVALDPL